MELIGVIKKILEPQSGISKATEKEWKKVNVIVSNNDGYEGAEQIFCFEIFGAEKVDKFIEYNKVGDNVNVAFNIRTNEYKGNYYTSLQAWMIKKVDVNAVVNESPMASVGSDDLPF